MLKDNRRGSVALFFSMPLDAQDWANVQRSTVQEIMIPWRWGAGNETYQVLTEAAKRKLRVILRLTADDMQRALFTLTADLRAVSSLLVPSAIILGVEPDAGFKAEWGTDWGDQAAWGHVARLRAVADALHPFGIPLVSPGHLSRPYTESEPPQPGIMPWREICAPAYNGDLKEGRSNGIGANGVHLYAYSWVPGSFIDRLRLHYQLNLAATLWHQRLWIDEIGVATGTELQRMIAICDMARAIEGEPGGNRVDKLIPFVSNGQSDGSWNPDYVMRDPACYDALAAYLAGH